MNKTGILDSKEIIAKAVPGDWFLLARRSEAPFLPLVYKIETLDSMEFCDLYGSGIRSLLKCDHSVIELFFKSEDYRILVEKNNKDLLLTAKVENHVKRAEELCLAAQQQAKAIGELDLKSCTVDKLSSLYKQVIQAYKWSFIYGFVTWFVQVLQCKALEIIKEKSNIIDDLKIGDKEVLNSLILSDKDSPYKKKQIELDILAKEYKDSLSALTINGEEVIRENLPEADQAIRKFLDNYKWVGYDYGGPEISYDEVISLILSWGSHEKDKYSKEELIELLGLDPEEQKVFHVLSLMSYVKDLRNSSDDIIHYNLDFLFQEIADRFYLSKEKVRNMLPAELDTVLHNGQKPKDTEDNLLIDLFNGFSNPRYSKGREAKELFSALIGDGQEKDILSTKTLSGMSASAGYATGQVKVVNSLEDTEKFEEGSILVTHMTSPRFLNAILKCGAIVTNEGGLTCHAAIIAREMKKPCIISTRIATKVLKDGDLVEVDATKGLVKILNSTKQSIIERRR